MRALVILLLLAGCTLVDQRTFRAAAPAPGAEEVARARGPNLPLVSLRMEQFDRGLLAEAVQAAQQRKPDVTFDVQAMVPSSGASDQRIAEASADAKTVAEAMGAAGVSPERVRLGLRGDPGTPAREVRIYVR